MSEILNQDEVDILLKKIDEVKSESLTSFQRTKKIKLYDFKRPNKFSREELRDISNAVSLVAKGFKKFLISEYDINVKINVASVDELTCEEFIHTIPTPTPYCTFNWMDGAGVFEIDPAIFFNGVLGCNYKKNHEANGLESKIFMEYIYKPFEKILHTTFSTIAEKNLPEITNSKYESNTIFASNIIWQIDMGVLITLEAKVGQTQGYINLFFNTDCIECLRNSSFFSRPNSVNIVPIKYPEPNTIIEIGRFCLEAGETLKEKYIYETNKLAGLPLNVYKEGTYVGKGEAVVIDDNVGIRIVTKQDELDEMDKLDEQEKDDFYNTKVIFGGCITEDNFKFDDGSILELDEYFLDPVKIVKDGKIIGWGKVVVVDERFGIKVTKVV